MDKTMAVYLAEPVADFLAVTATALLFAHQFPPGGARAGD